MNATQTKQQYFVFPGGDRSATIHLADKAVVEPSGVLALYITDSEGRDNLVQAFAVGAWRELRRSESSV